MDEKKKDLWAVVLICAAVYCAYLNSLSNSFVFDDRHMILQNNYIKHLRFIPLFFKGELTSFPIARGMYRPILMLTFTFNYFFAGLAPHSYHLINILIHFLNACLLYFLLKLLIKSLSFPLSLGVVLAFCLHPINTEAVAYISGRSTILSSFFILSSLYAYIRWRICLKRYLYPLSLGLYILALLTKETSLVLPFLIAAYEFVYTPDLLKNLKRVFLRLFPFLLISLGCLILIKMLFKGLFVKRIILPWRFSSHHILTQAAVALFYPYLFFHPFNLCVDHSFPIIKSFLTPLGSIPLISISLLITAALLWKKRLGILSFSCLWYFIALLPSFYGKLNLVAAEHHAYLASFSLYFILGYLLSKWHIKKIYLRLGFLYVLGLFFLLTLLRNFQWHDEYLIWRYNLKANPKSGIAQGSLGLDLWNKGYLDEAEKYLRQSAESSLMASSRQISWLNLASFYASQGKPLKALEILRQNRSLLGSVDAVIYLRVLGYIYLRMEKFPEARDIWEKAAKLSPEYAEIRSDLAELYLDHFKDEKKAKEYFQSAIQSDPDLALAHFNLAGILEKEDLKQAISEYEKTIQLMPAVFNPYYRLGVIYAMKLKDTRAEWYFKKTIELSPEFAPAYYNLCVFYLSLPSPDFKLAREYCHKAKELGYKIDQDIQKILDKESLPP